MHCESCSALHRGDPCRDPCFQREHGHLAKECASTQKVERFRIQGVKTGPWAREDKAAALHAVEVDDSVQLK